MKESWTKDEAIALLIQKRAAGEDFHFHDGVAHYSFGCDKSGFWHSYYCCEGCNEWDYEECQTEEELRELLKYNDGPWYAMAPQASALP